MNSAGWRPGMPGPLRLDPRNCPELPLRLDPRNCPELPPNHVEQDIRWCRVAHKRYRACGHCWPLSPAPKFTLGVSTSGTTLPQRPPRPTRLPRLRWPTRPPRPPRLPRLRWPTRPPRPIRPQRPPRLHGLNGFTASTAVWYAGAGLPSRPWSPHGARECPERLRVALRECPRKSPPPVDARVDSTRRPGVPGAPSGCPEEMPQATPDSRRMHSVDSRPATVNPGPK